MIVRAARSLVYKEVNPITEMLDTMHILEMAPANQTGTQPIDLVENNLLAHSRPHIRKATQNRSFELFTGLFADKVITDLPLVDLWEFLEAQPVGLITLVVSSPTLRKISVTPLQQSPSWKDIIREQLPVN